MSKAFGLIRGIFTAAFGLASWLAGEQMASAQVILAQSGLAKTMIGWLLVLLAIGLGLLVVCRPSGRRSPDSDK
jgi:hypothetical protein